MSLANQNQYHFFYESDELILFNIDGKILLEKSDKLKDNFKDIQKFSEESLKEIWENEDDEIWDSYLKK